jgi:hypothetical protein
MVAEALAKFKGVELSLNGLGSLSDKAAEALSKFKGAKLSLNGLSSLSEKGTEALSRVMLKARKDAWGQFECEELCLNGLTTLTDKGAEALSKCKAVLFLNGIKSLSDAAAKVLTGHRGTVKLCGLNELSDQGALSFSMNKSIEVSDQLAKQIANAVKNHAQTSSTLTSKDQSKIRKLITSQGADNVDFACNLLASLNASEGDWLKLFPKTRIFKLLSNWEESKIWNTLATAMKPHARLYEELKLQAKKRVNTNSYDGEVRWRYERFLDDLVKVANDDVVDVLKFARPDRVKKKKSSSSAD